MRSLLIKLAQDSGLPSSGEIYDFVRQSRLVAAMPNPSHWFARAPVAENSVTGKLQGETPVLSMGMSHGVIPGGKPTPFAGAPQWVNMQAKPVQQTAPTSIAAK